MGACTSKAVLKNVDDAPLPEEEREDVVVVEEVNEATVDADADSKRQSLGLLIDENEEKGSSEYEAEQVKQVVEPKESAAEAAVVDVVQTEEANKDVVETSDDSEVAQVEASDVKVSEEETEASEDSGEAEKVEEKTEEEVEVATEDTKAEEEKKTTDNKKPLFKLWF